MQKNLPERVTLDALEPFHIYVTRASVVGTELEGYQDAWLYLGKTNVFGLYTWLYIGSINPFMKVKDVYNAINMYGDPSHDRENVEWVKGDIKWVYTPVTNAKFNKYSFDIADSRVRGEVRKSLQVYM